jgi:hypothetical protein
MRPGDSGLIKGIEDRLSSFNHEVRKIPGVRAEANRLCLARQILDSIRRVRYVTTISNRLVSQSITDPTLESFNPHKAAVWFKNEGNYDEAFWLVFLATHFGKHKRFGWNLIRSVYGKLDSQELWTWDKVIEDPGEFGYWIENNSEALSDRGKFSNHRKYESIRKSGQVVSSYVDWIGEGSSHLQKIESLDQNEEDPTTLFDILYYSMNSVFRFGRTAKFDYLSMVGKLGLSNIEPGYVLAP